MYTAFYGLREKPFALSPDPRFLYLASSHREALAHLLYGIEQGEGFISVTGEVGTGKTTLCRTLLERLEGEFELAFLFNPSRTALELLQSICAEFGLPAEGLNRRTLMTQLNKFLVEQKRIGRRVLLIIDESQTLSENTLEQVRLLSNLETSRDKLIQILLLGQPELDRKLDERGLRQLRQRISVRWQLDPLSPQETRAYVRHRLAVAAGEPKDLFSEAALREVHRRTGGIPRLVNQLCDRALLAGYASRAAQIGPRIIRAAAKEIPDTHRRRDRGGERDKRPAFLRPWMMLAGTLALVGLALFAGLSVGRSGLGSSLGSGAAAGIPPVSANAPNTPGTPDGPDATELLGNLPNAIQKELRPGLEGVPPAVGAGSGTGFGGGPGTGAGLVASSTSLAIPNGPVQNLPETALATGLLSELLEKRDGRVALSESRAALLERFGRLSPATAPAPKDVPALERSLRDRGLTATSFEGGSIELLRRLDHPVVLPLSTRPTRGGTNGAPASERWIAITGFRNDRARVAGLVSDRIVTIEIAELERHWLEIGIIVWERFEPVPEVLLGDDQGEGVRWLQGSLAELGFFGDETSGRYDAETLEAVSSFQRARGLVADGVAGPLTQIALYSQLRRYPVPRLSQFAEARPPSPRPEIASPRASSYDANPTPPATSTARLTGDRG